MFFIFLDSSSFCISSFWITSVSVFDACSPCLEISLRILFSRSSSRLLIFKLWTLSSVTSLFVVSFWRTFLSFFFFFSEASSSVSIWCPRCSPASLQDTQIQAASSVQ
ncbi:hypothetical protein GDO81_021756 [Engystomops pustulosus]|uniref:Uncharacterized protein n=1 Tax=Engystomops pustulosus TaxID=76066 RepID=A0AAV6ZIQ9_ENGPU|nr:hypothetical protein GDO81_021756 [Engystomops pustulosus]